MDNSSKEKIIVQGSKKTWFMPFLGNIINPRKNWIFLLVLLTVFVVISIVFDLYMYYKISNGDLYVIVKTEDVTVENLKSVELQKILDNFETKKNNIGQLKLENLVDPSI